MLQLKDPSRCVIDNCQNVQNSIDDCEAIKLILYKTKTESQQEQDFYQYICQEHFNKYKQQPNLILELLKQNNTPRNAVEILKMDEYRIDINKQHPCVQCHQSKLELCNKLLELIIYADTPEKKFYLAKSEIMQQFLRDKNLFSQLKIQIVVNQQNSQSISGELMLILSYLENLKRQYRDFDNNNVQEIRRLLD